MNLQDISSLIKQLEQFKFPHTPKEPTNIFGIGTKGMFENPFTEIFSYIINQESEYQQRDIFLKTFLNQLPDINERMIEGLLEETYVFTQVCTCKGNYIDMVIQNEESVLVFENKINHWLANPLEDYESEINKKYRGKSINYFVLSYKKIDLPKDTKWKNIQIGSIFEEILKQIPSSEKKDKWDYFVIDFLKHYIPTREFKMTNEEFNFYKDNYIKVIEANNGLNDFINSIFSKIQSGIKDGHDLTRTIIRGWDGGNSLAIRCRPLLVTDSDVVFVLRNDGKFNISIYYQKDYDSFSEILEDVVGIDYKKGHECHNTYTCFTRLDNKLFPSIDDAIKECIKQINKMIEYYE